MVKQPAALTYTTSSPSTFVASRNDSNPPHPAQSALPGSTCSSPGTCLIFLNVSRCHMLSLVSREASLVVRISPPPKGQQDFFFTFHVSRFLFPFHTIWS
jgi:hypothetical protein